jgi:hypothetical protein
MKICQASTQLEFTFDNRFSSTGWPVPQSVRYRIFCLQASYLSATSHTGRKSCQVKSLYMKRFWSHVRLYGPLHVFHLPGTYQQILYSMDEGTLKTPIPKCRLYWSIFWGRWSNFVGSKSVQKQSEKLLQKIGLQHDSTPPPHTATHCLYIL